MRQVYFIGGLVLGVIIAIFAVQNPMSVEIRFLWWQTQGPLAAAVLISAAAGALVALLLGIPEVFGARWRIRSLERRLGDLPSRDAKLSEGKSDEPPRI
ncbi:MAG: hypothetical protein A2Z31_08090 [candidate division NC10 bacterium RBG_16_65_8]|nr:MAG: hypothetical protein A2Z31_08090 [candidate division NC10 bacterium RBG_16_65_8]